MSDSDTEVEVIPQKQTSGNKDCNEPIKYRVIESFLENNENKVLAIYEPNDIIKIQFGENVEIYSFIEGELIKKTRRNSSLLVDYSPGDSIELDPLSWYFVISQIPRKQCTRQDNSVEAEKMLINRAAYYLEQYNKKRISKKEKLLRAQRFLFSTLPFYKLLKVTYLEEKINEFKVINKLKTEKDDKVLVTIAERMYMLTRSYIISP